MKTKKIYLVKDSFNLLSRIPTETIGELFYNRLFEIAPEIRPIFGHAERLEQSRKMITMLTYIVGRLDNLDAIKSEITKLVQPHVRYGVVEPKLYEPVGEALIWTLEKALGINWNNEVKIAWMVCYIMLSNTIIEACELIEI